MRWETYAASSNKGNSFFISDGSYLRLKNVHLEYQIPMNNNVFKGLRVYCSGTNLLTLTGYEGFTPDVNFEGMHPTRRGFDSNGYPPARTVLLGIKADF
jgi:hypothetical protein